MLCDKRLSGGTVGLIFAHENDVMTQGSLRCSKTNNDVWRASVSWVELVVDMDDAHRLFHPVYRNYTVGQNNLTTRRVGLRTWL